MSDPRHFDCEINNFIFVPVLVSQIMLVCYFSIQDKWASEELPVGKGNFIEKGAM